MERPIHISLSALACAAVMTLAGCSNGADNTAALDNMYTEFQNPPASARPRVWWHWMDGNVTKEGIYKDLTWMKRQGIAGFMNFDAGFSTEQIVPERLMYMTDGWKDAFNYATHLADSLGMEMSIACSPGWSFTGGPWVEGKDGMKKLVWREVRVTGGQTVDIKLPEPYKTIGKFQNVPLTSDATEGYYDDIAVLAVKLPDADVDVTALNPQITSSGGSFSLAQLTDGDMQKTAPLPPGPNGKGWIQYDFGEPRTMKALTVVDGQVRGQWQMPKVEIDKSIAASDDGVNFTEIMKIPNSSAVAGTVTFPATTARYFRIYFDNKAAAANPYAALMGYSAEAKPAPTNIAELKLYPVYRINHAEEKAGFAAPADLYLYDTPDDGNAVALSDVLDITDNVKDGQLTWDAPAGEWKILRFGYSQTGKKNSPAPPEATGFEIDKMDADAVKRYFEHYIGMYKDIVGDEWGKTIKYLMADSYESEQENWTPLMLAAFESHRGYELLPWLPVLTGQVVGSAEQSEKFLRDWRKTLGELVVESLYDQMTDILREYGMGRYTESHENGRVYLAEGMEVKKNAAVPMAAAWMPNNTGASTPPMAQADIRESASVAHIYGQNLVAGESVNAPGGEGKSYAYHPANIKPIADMELYSGLNRFVVHTSVHQPVDDRRPGLGLGPIGQWFNRLDCWTESAWAWVDYLSRSSYMLQQGHYVADIVYYYGEDNNIAGMFGNELPPVPSGYSFDFINSDALLNLLKVSRTGNLTTPSGMRYRVLVLDDNAKKMTIPVLRKIAELAKGGAIICGAKPEKPAGLTDDPAEFEQLVKEIWESGKSNVYTDKSMLEVLKDNSIKPDVALPEGSGLRFVHRTTSAAEIYWVNNPDTTQAKTVDLTFRVKGKKPEVWHPETGKKEDVSYTINGDNTTTVTLNLVEGDALFVVFGSKADANEVKLPDLKESTLLTVTTPWTVTFQENRGAPAEAVTFDQLIDLSNAEDPAVKYFSGEATYKTTIDVPAIEEGSKLTLDLGNVGVMAEVTVNGNNLGLYWKKPFVIDVTDAISTGSNEIEVKVTNLWINRLIGDSRPDMTEKVTWSQYPMYRPTSQMSPSGLMGPVRLISKNR